MDHGLIVIGTGITMTQTEAIALLAFILIPITLTFMGLWLRNLPLAIASGIAWMGVSFLPMLGTGFPLDPAAGEYWVIRAVCFTVGLSLFLISPITALVSRNTRLEEERRSRKPRVSEEDEYSALLDKEIRRR